MEKHKTTTFLNFMKCIINKTDISWIRLSLNLNSNTRISPMNDKSIYYLKELNGLFLFKANNEM